MTLSLLNVVGLSEFEILNLAYEKATLSEWVELLIKKPEYSDNFDFSKMKKYSKHDECLKLITAQPQLTEKIIKHISFDVLASLILYEKDTNVEKYYDFTQLKKDQWVHTLILKPEFAKYCDWSKLDGCSWSNLLTDQPQFAEHCDWSKLDYDDWGWLLNEQPKFAKHCDPITLTSLRKIM